MDNTAGPGLIEQTNIYTPFQRLNQIRFSGRMKGIINIKPTFFALLITFPNILLLKSREIVHIVFFSFDALTSQSTAMVMCLTTLFFLRKLDYYAVNQFFVHILSLVTDNNPSWISGREKNGCRNYFMTYLHKTMGPNRNRTHDP